MANTSKVIDLDRLARFKAKQDAANDAKFALKGEGGSIATADKAGIVKPAAISTSPRTAPSACTRRWASTRSPFPHRRRNAVRRSRT